MDIYHILEWVYYIFFSTIFIPILIILGHWSKTTASERRVAWLIFSYLIIELVSIILRYNLIRNHFLYYVLTIANLLFMAEYFSSSLGRVVCISIAIAISIAMFIEVFFFVGFNHINSFTLTLSNALIVIGAFVGLRKLLNGNALHSLSRQQPVFLYLGLIIISFFSLATSAFKSKFIDTSLELYYFFDTLDVIAKAAGFLIIARGFWIGRNNRSWSLRKQNA